MTKKEYLKVRSGLDKSKKKGLVRLLDYLWENEKSTARQIRKDIGMEQVAEGVRKLRHNHHVPVEMEMVSGQNRYGEPVRYGEYSIQRRR